MKEILLIRLMCTLCFFLVVTSCSKKPEAPKEPSLEEELAKFLAGEWEYGGNKVIVTYEGLKGVLFFREHGGYFIQPPSVVPDQAKSVYQGTWKVESKNRITIFPRGKSRSRSSYNVFIIDEDHIRFRDTTPPYYDTNFVFTRLSTSPHAGKFVYDLKIMSDLMEKEIENYEATH